MAGKSERAMRIFVSPSAAERLACARDVLRGSPPEARQLVIGASRGAADDLVREVAAECARHFRDSTPQPDAARGEDRARGARGRRDDAKHVAGRRGRRHARRL